MSVVKTPGLEIAKTLGEGYYFTPLPYWHEGTDYTWAKLDLQEGDNEIWVYYGSETATDESDGDGVFEFFDDFSTWSGWTQHSSGTVSQDTTTFGFPVLKKSNAGDPSGGYKEAGSFERGICLRARVHRKSADLSGANSDRIGLIDSNGDGYGVHMDHGNDELKIDKRDGFSATEYGNLSVSDVLDTWYVAEIRALDARVIAVLLPPGGSEISTEVSDTSYNSFTRVYVFGGYTYYVDWIAVRKYSSSPPSISYSSEESGSWTIDGHTFTKRKKVTITSSQALSGYQIQLDYSQWGEPGIKIMRKVQVVGELG